MLAQPVIKERITLVAYRIVCVQVSEKASFMLEDLWVKMTPFSQTYFQMGRF